MKLLLIGLTLALLAAGCGRAVDRMSEAPASPGPTATATQPAPPQTTNAPTRSQESGCPSNSLEKCFSYSQMSTFLDTVEPMVAQYFQKQFPQLPSPRPVSLIPHGRAAASRCGGYSDDQAYEYCPADQRIFIGQDLLWTFYSRAGDAAPVVALAHEWGHHIQNWLDVPFPGTTAESVNYENQADCIAGSFTKYAGEQGWLESDDVGNVETLLQAIGSSERQPGRDHGTTAERENAFNLGFKGGVKACNAYSPGTNLA